MNTITIIPARGGSKRIPGKNLLNLQGKPLIAHSIEQAKNSQLTGRVIVSTDDKEIAKVSVKYGAEVFERPAALASDTATSEDALLNVLDSISERQEALPELIVFLQCTSPLRKPDDIDNAINTLLEKEADSLFSAFVFNKYIWRIKNGIPEPVNYDYNKRWREQDFPVQYQENGSIYVLKPWVLKDLKNRLGGTIAVYEMDPLDSFQIDTPEDIELCECILRLKGRKGQRK